MTKLKLRRNEFEQHTIVNDEGRVVGHVRVAPHSILWKSAGTSSWYAVPLHVFAEYAKRSGIKWRGNGPVPTASLVRPTW